MHQQTGGTIVVLEGGDRVVILVLMLLGHAWQIHVSQNAMHWLLTLGQLAPASCIHSMDVAFPSQQRYVLLFLMPVITMMVHRVASTKHSTTYAPRAKHKAQHCIHTAYRILSLLKAAEHHKRVYSCVVGLWSWSVLLLGCLYRL